MDVWPCANQVVVRLVGVDDHRSTRVSRTPRILNERISNEIYGRTQGLASRGSATMYLQSMERVSMSPPHQRFLST